MHSSGWTSEESTILNYGLMKKFLQPVLSCKVVKTSYLIAAFFIMPILSINTCRATERSESADIQYISKIFHRSFIEFSPGELSISLVNWAPKPDMETIKTMSDVFLWSTGLKTELKLSNESRLNVIYIEDFSSVEDVEFANEAMKKLYIENFATIRAGGSCTKITATDKLTDKKTSLLFINKLDAPEIRGTCIYRHYRSLFGISEMSSMPNWADTFVNDLRALRCKYIKALDIPSIEVFLDRGC